MDIADRINQKMQELGISQAIIVRGTGASRAAVSGWVNGINSPSAKHIGSLAKTLRTTEGWLLHGLVDNLNNTELWNTDSTDNYTEIAYFEEFAHSYEHKSIFEVMENQTNKLKIPKITLHSLGINSNKAFATHAPSGAMSPTVKNGDTVYIDMARKNIKDGRIFAIFHGGLFSIKRLYNLPLGGVRIVSDNSNEFPEVTLNAQDIKDQQFEVIGWVWQISSLEKW